MKLSDIEKRLCHIQADIVTSRENNRSSLEYQFWAELSRLYERRAYEKIIPYVSWLADYHRREK